jgi:hypothetical protein
MLMELEIPELGHWSCILLSNTFIHVSFVILSREYMAHLFHCKLVSKCLNTPAMTNSSGITRFTVKGQFVQGNLIDSLNHFAFLRQTYII